MLLISVQQEWELQEAHAVVVAEQCPHVNRGKFVSISLRANVLHSHNSRSCSALTAGWAEPRRGPWRWRQSRSPAPSCWSSGRWRWREEEPLAPATWLASPYCRPSGPTFTSLSCPPGTARRAAASPGTSWWGSPSLARSLPASSPGLQSNITSPPPGAAVTQTSPCRSAPCPGLTRSPSWSARTARRWRRRRRASSVSLGLSPGRIRIWDGAWWDHDWRVLTVPGGWPSLTVWTVCWATVSWTPLTVSPRCRPGVTSLPHGAAPPAWRPRSLWWVWGTSSRHLLTSRPWLGGQRASARTLGWTDMTCWEDETWLCSTVSIPASYTVSPGCLCPRDSNRQDRDVPSTPCRVELTLGTWWLTGSQYAAPSLGNTSVRWRRRWRRLGQTVPHHPASPLLTAPCQRGRAASTEVITDRRSWGLNRKVGAPGAEHQHLTAGTAPVTPVRRTRGEGSATNLTETQTVLRFTDIVPLTEIFTSPRWTVSSTISSPGTLHSAALKRDSRLTRKSCYGGNLPGDPL